MTGPAAAHRSWHELEVGARIRFLANLATAPPGVVVVEQTAGVTTVTTGVFDNTLNGVFHARLAASDADAAIAATLARFRRRRAPAIWWLDPANTPADLPRRLAAAGCRPEQAGIVRGGLVADLHRRAGQLLAAAGGGPAGAGEARITVEAVGSPDDLDRWIGVARACWGAAADGPPGDLARRRALYAGLGLGPAAALRHWVAVAGRRAVGLCSAFYADPEQVLLVDHVDVVEAARRRGVGTALLHAALGEARRRGCRWAVLEPTPGSAAFYDRLGFGVEACRPGVQFYLPLEPLGQAAVGRPAR